jgi:hypothetical protein
MLIKGLTEQQNVYLWFLKKKILTFLNNGKMKENELNLALKARKQKVWFVMELTPEQSLEIKMIAPRQNTTVKAMILKAFDSDKKKL